MRNKKKIGSLLLDRGRVLAALGQKRREDANPDARWRSNKRLTRPTGGKGKRRLNLVHQKKGTLKNQKQGILPAKRAPSRRLSKKSELCHGGLPRKKRRCLSRTRRARKRKVFVEKRSGGKESPVGGGSTKKLGVLCRVSKEKGISHRTREQGPNTR